MAQSLLGLPPVSKDLKAVAPYLQRADELKHKEPIMAYWCAYYAAQVGISLKAKDTDSRSLLFELLSKLERMKSEIGANDAIDMEVASSAYVENFALRVFAMADNEDRKGQSSRSTAKKFLAAANFLEVLKIFPKADVSDSNEEKIRYAKWKAADIAKAFREGRKPAPGPAGSELMTDITPDSITNVSLPSVSSSSTIVQSNGSQASSSTSTLGGGSPPSKSSGHRRRESHSSSSPPRISPPSGYSALANNDNPITPPRKGKPGVNISESLSVTGAWGGEGDLSSPGGWSTAATPGTANHTPGLDVDESNYPNRSGTEPESPTKEARDRKDERKHRRSGSEAADTTSDLPATYRSNGNANAEALGLTGGGAVKKSVHFTPSVVGGLSSNGGSPPVTPGYDSFPGSPSEGEVHPGMDPYFQTLPPGFIPIANRNQNPAWNGYPQQIPTQDVTPHPPQIYAASPPNHTTPQPPQIYVNNPSQQTPQIYAPNPHVSPQPPAQAPSIHSTPPQIYANTPSPPQPPPPQPQIYAQPSAPPLQNTIQHGYSPPQAAPLIEVELTPTVIAKAQKHARFAISALDYEDAEQARRELRSALAILGG